jgi:RNA polymerase sigma factor (sigma-70 family)
VATNLIASNTFVNNDIISRIKSGDEKSYFALYKTHRESFINWATFSYNISIEDTKDLYQETFLILWNNIREEKLTHLTADIKTYIFSIGKHLILNFIKKKNRSVTFEPSLLINESYKPFDMTHNDDHNRIMVEEHLSKLEPKERRILEMYYIEEKDMKTIAAELGYKNADVAKKRKYEVFRKLAGLVKNNLQLFLF